MPVSQSPTSFVSNPKSPNTSLSISNFLRFSGFFPCLFWSFTLNPVRSSFEFCSLPESMARCCLEVQIERFKTKSPHSCHVLRVKRFESLSHRRVSLPVEVDKRNRLPMSFTEVEVKGENVSKQRSPILFLHKTRDHLLDLLRQPYGDSFSSLYTFFCNKLREVELDPRMQQQFNVELITMLEQLIWFHITAMHEVSAHTKGSRQIVSVEQNRLVALWSRYNERLDIEGSLMLHVPGFTQCRS